MEIKNLIERYPRLYHMAEKDTWPSIKANGLLSTTAVLDRFGINGSHRRAIEQGHRPEKMLVGPEEEGIIIRDQKPMYPDRLAGALIDGSTPAQWYKFLNGRVFMWAQEERLFGLLGARQYRKLEHDVLTIDTSGLLAAHCDKVWLCRMNSGNTFPVPHPRAMTDFMRIADYPAKKRTGAPAKEVVEIVFDYSIPDIAAYVTEVRRIKGEEVLGTIPL